MKSKTLGAIMITEIADKTFTFPYGTQKLEVKEIDGERWVPFCGNRISAALAKKRVEIGGFDGLACVEGWHVTYRPISCVSVRALGWMSTYCK